RLQLYRLAISSVTRDIQNGSSFLLFELDSLIGSLEINRLLRTQRAEGWRTRRPGRGCSSRRPRWPERFCSGPGSLLRDHRDEAGLVVTRFDRLGATFPRRSISWRSVHRNHRLTQKVRS